MFVIWAVLFSETFVRNAVGTVPKNENCEESFEFPRKEDSETSMNSQSQAFF